MKFSLNTLRAMNQRYNSASDIMPDGLDNLVQRIGAQLGAIEEVIDLGAKYQAIVIAKVVSCQPHPNADRLNLCLIDDGKTVKDVPRNDQGYVQVVCGAANCREGLLVAWLPPGAVVPETVGKDPFTLEAREIRGIISNGMLASPKELALGDSHAGILEIDGDPTPGSDFSETFGLKDDTVLDIENKMFTHRPDCFGFLGVSRELAGIQGLSYKSPDWYHLSPKFPDPETDELPLVVKNELPELVPRFTAITMANVKVGMSPVWLQVEMAKIGLKSINNIVDYTNFYMMLTGQPLHAYDYDKVKALSSGPATIVIRKPQPKESLKLLNGKELTPRPEAIMIATDKTLIGLAGIMGGSETEVDGKTTNIIIECANFDMYSVRRTSMAHGLFTDALTRFTKGQSPLQNLAVLAKIVDEIRRYADGQVATRVIDDNHLTSSVKERGSVHPPVNVTPEFINARLGIELSSDAIKKLLENVEFKISQAGNQLTITAPFWRTDIELPEDIVEEVGRLYGFDNLPLILPDRSLEPAQKDKLLTTKSAIRHSLAESGANEVLTYSFINASLLKKALQDQAHAFQIANALSPDLQYYRLSLVPSLLEKVHPNIKAGYDQFALFEMGKVHDSTKQQDGLPAEFDRLALVTTADPKAANSYSGAAYYQARKYLMRLLKTFGLQDKTEFQALQADKLNDDSAYYDLGRSSLVVINDQPIGYIGEFKPSVRLSLKLPVFTAGFELDLSQLTSALSQKTYQAIPRFPGVTQDISLKVASSLSYQALYALIDSEISKLEPTNSIHKLTPLDIYQGDNKDLKHITLRLHLSCYDRTLTDEAVNSLLDKVALAAKDKLGAERI